ncbi:MAG: YncE family protein [Flaviaesturariibacter sp.]|nr:YncE family protein [Flaviaesturariibacter sp.]
MNLHMKKLMVFVLSAFALFASAQKKASFAVAKTFLVGGIGGWDYLATSGGKLYVSHGTQVNILDEKTGDSVGVLLNTAGVHGIAFDLEQGRGYTSNGRSNDVLVFDLKTGAELGRIKTGENPDAILYEPHSKKIVTCNGRSKDLSVIDVVSGNVVATVPAGGKPETAVSDGAGRLFVNNEDKSEIVVVNTNTWLVEAHWTIAPGEAPTGLAIDRKTKRLFAGCDNKLLMVIDATNGHLIGQVPIGDGCDGVAFDPRRKLVFTSNGEGTLTVIKETGSRFTTVGTYPTKRGARTIAIDEKDGTIFLPTADLEKSDTPGGRPRVVPGSFQVLVIK